MSPLLKEDTYGLFVDSDGTRTQLDQRACEAVRMTLSVVEGGKARTSGNDPLITTGSAAKMLGVSRRTVTRIMDAGDLPFVREGRGHRLTHVSDVLRYKEESQRQEALLEEMRENMCKGGLEDLDKVNAYLSQFDEEKAEA